MHRKGVTFEDIELFFFEGATKHVMETFQITVIKKSACVKLYRVQEEDWDCRRRFSLRAASLFAAIFLVWDSQLSTVTVFFSAFSCSDLATFPTYWLCPKQE